MIGVVLLLCMAGLLLWSRGELIKLPKRVRLDRSEASKRAYYYGKGFKSLVEDPALLSRGGATETTVHIDTESDYLLLYSFHDLHLSTGMIFSMAGGYSGLFKVIGGSGKIHRIIQLSPDGIQDKTPMKLSRKWKNVIVFGNTYDPLNVYIDKKKRSISFFVQGCLTEAGVNLAAATKMINEGVTIKPFYDKTKLVSLRKGWKVYSKDLLRNAYQWADGSYTYNK